MSGFDAAQMNYVRFSFKVCFIIDTITTQTLLPIILGHTPAGTSVKTVTQFAQVPTLSYHGIKT